LANFFRTRFSGRFPEGYPPRPRWRAESLEWASRAFSSVSTDAFIVSSPGETCRKHFRDFKRALELCVARDRVVAVYGGKRRMYCR